MLCAESRSRRPIDVAVLVLFLARSGFAWSRRQRGGDIRDLGIRPSSWNH